MPDYPKYEGNRPSTVSRDAKYHVRTGAKGKHVVAIYYEAEDDERWYATSEDHPALVQMVNDVKISVTGKPNGAFYINEYKQLIVPAGDEVYYAGVYEGALRFEFEGKILSGEAIDLAGNPIHEGDTWVGPHPGVPYTYSGRFDDVTYVTNPRPNVEKTVKLAKVALNEDIADRNRSKIKAVTGYAGGRFYVNEFLCIFKPVQEGQDLRYVYAGQLDLEGWFPKPHQEPS